MKMRLEGVLDVQNNDLITSKYIEKLLASCDERTLNLIHELIEKECKKRLPDSYVGTNCNYIYFKSVLDKEYHKEFFQAESIEDEDYYNDLVEETEV